MRTIQDIRQDHVPVIIMGHCSTLPNVVESLELVGRRVHGIMDRDYRGQEHVMGLPLLPDHEYLRAGTREQYEFFVATGWQPGRDADMQRTNAKREQYLEWMSRFNLVGATIIHPTAVISPGAKFGRNVRVGALAMVNHGAVVHDHATIRDQAYVSHDVTVGRDSVVQIGARLTGNVQLGEHVYVGVSSTVVARRGRPMLLADHSVTWPGVTVMRALKAGETYSGRQSRIS